MKVLATSGREQSVAAFDVASPLVFASGVMAGVAQANPAVFAIALLLYGAAKHPRGLEGRRMADSFGNQIVDTALGAIGYAFGDALVAAAPSALKKTGEIIS